MPALAASLLLSPAESSAQTYTNPITSISGAPADPCIRYFNGFYYIYPTNNTSRYEAYRSTNLSSWTNTGTITSGTMLWAPDVFYWAPENRYYLWGTENGSSGFYATNTSPQGTFTRVSGTSMPGIDHTSIIDQQGRLWHMAQSGGINLYDHPLTKSTGEYAAMPRIIDIWDQGSEEAFNEGPEMIHHNGKYYYFYSSGSASTATYNQNYAVSDSPIGPFVKFPGNPILQTQWVREIVGPGHAGTVQAPDGEYWICYQQFPVASQGFSNRRLAIDRLWFDESDVIHVDATRGVAKPNASLPFPVRSAIAQIAGDDYNGKSGGFFGNRSDINNFTGVNAMRDANGLKSVSFRNDPLYTLNYAAYRQLNFGTGVNSVSFRVASSVSTGQNAGTILVRAGGVHGPIVGRVSFNGTGSDSTWTTITTPIGGELTGTRDLILEFSGTRFSVNWFQFTTDTPVNVAPEAVNDKIDVYVNTPLTFDPTLNDIDFNNNIAALTAVGTPSKGQAALSGTTITYTPNPGFVGTDSFTYTVRDAQNLTSTATVNVNVHAPGPVIVFEAEDGIGLMTEQRWAVLNDANASGGRYITHTGEGFSTGSDRKSPEMQTAWYSFYARAPGLYQVQLRALAPNASSRSVTVGMMGADHTRSRNLQGYPTHVKYNAHPATGVYEWSTAQSSKTESGDKTCEWWLEPGWHVFELFSPSAGFRIDQIRIIPPTAGAGPIHSVPVFNTRALAGALGVVGQSFFHSVLNQVSDPDATSLTFSKVSGPSWINVSSAGAVTGIPAAGDVGLNKVRIRVTDNDNKSAEADLSISIYANASSIEAFDGFETQDFKGGIGWKDSEWTTFANNNSVRPPQTVTQTSTFKFKPFEGSGGAWLRQQQWILRTVDLTGSVNPQLSITSWLQYIDGGNWVQFDVWDGVKWHLLHKQTTADSAYVTRTFSLDAFNKIADFKIRILLNSGLQRDRDLALDNIRVTGLAAPVAASKMVSLGATSYSITEGNSGSQNLAVTVNRSGDSAGAISVNYATANGAATAGSDYTAASGTLNWASGDMSPKTILIPILGDTTFEIDETFSISLSNPSSGVILSSPSSATITILNDDEGPGILAFAQDSYSIIEGDSGSQNLVVTVNRTSGANGAVSASYATANGTATAGSDYTAVSGTLNWADGDSSPKTISIPILGDTIYEPNETFTVTLSSPTGGAFLGLIATTTITIENDEVIPAIVLSMGEDTIANGSVVGLGSINPGEQSVVIFTIANSDLGLLTLGTTTIGTPTNSTVEILTAPASSVPGGETTSLVLGITPTAAGAWSFGVSIPSNDPNTPTFSFTLQGSSIQSNTLLYWGGGIETPTTSVNTTSATVSNLTGTWNSAITNWNTDPTAASGYQSWINNGIAVLKSTNAASGNSATITLDTSPTLGGLQGSWPGSSSTNQNFHLVGSGGSVNQTLTLAPDAAITLSGVTSSNSGLYLQRAGHVAGQGAVVLAGENFNLNAATAAVPLVIGSDSTIAGTATVNSGNLQIGVANGSASSSGSLLNIERFNVLAGNARLTVMTDSTKDAISDDAQVRLANAAFYLNSPSNAVSARETLSGISIEGSAWMFMDSRPNATASTQAVLTLTNGFSRGTNGKGVLIASNGSNTDGGLDTADGIRIEGHGIPASQAAIPWAVLQGRYKNVSTGTDEGTAASARFLATDASGNLRGANSVAANPSLSGWGSYTAASHLHIDTTATGYFSGTLGADTAIGTLAVGGANASVSGTLSLAGRTLRANAIALAVNNTTNLLLGTADTSRGTVTANGTTGGDLYLLHHRSSNAAASTFTLNSIVADNGGTVNLILGGPIGQFAVNSNSTHTGKTHINTGKVTLGSGAGFANSSEINISIGAQIVSTAANIAIGNGTIAQLLSGGGNSAGIANLQATTRTVTLGANATLNPGNTGANNEFVFEFTSGKLAFAAGSTLALDLDKPETSDRLRFLGTSAGNWMEGTPSLLLTLGGGFDYGKTYTIIENVNPVSFSIASITGHDTASYTAQVSKAGNSYVLSFTPVAQSNRYTVLYNGNGHDNGSAPIDPASPHEAGSTVIVLGNTGGLIKDGHVFSGWNTTAIGNGTPYAPGDTYVMPETNVSLFAQWSPVLEGYDAWADAIDWNGADSSPEADPDGEGLPNLVEYALGGSPLAASPGPVLAYDAPQQRLTYTFTPEVITGLLYFIESSENLINWSSTDVTPLLTAGQPYSHVEPLPLADRRFLRLRIVTAE